VLDNDLSLVNREPKQTAASNCRRAIQVEINVAGARDFHAGDTIDFSDFSDDFFRNGARGLLEATRELKRNGCSEFAKIDLRSLVKDYFRRMDVPMSSNLPGEFIPKGCGKAQ